MTEITCPVCASSSLHLWHKAKPQVKHYLPNGRQFLACTNCFAVHVPKTFHLNSAQEKSIYDLHENNSEDIAYQDFLSRIISPIKDALHNKQCSGFDGRQGLDYGCGPAPVLSRLLSQQGAIMNEYDLYYANDTSALLTGYDFITMTEVLEHLATPQDVLIKLWGMLKPGGVLAIMTKRVLSQDRFAQWQYKNDPTHIVFYSASTFEYLAGRLNALVSFPANDICILKKPMACTH